MKINNQEPLSGFVSTRSLLGHGKDKEPYREKSKSKDKKKDWSKERQRKRNYD